MAITTQQISERLLKKSQGVAETNYPLATRGIGEEALSTYGLVVPSNIWTEAEDIPIVPPVLTNGSIEGVVQYYEKLQLVVTDGGTTVAFKSPSGETIDAISSRFGFGYNFKIYDSAGTTQIYKGDWIVDSESGTIIFYNPGLAEATVNAANPPRISFYKYVGKKGFDVSLVPITYNDLYTLTQTSGLTAGQTYIINDYQTVHTIPNTTDTNTGQIEPLLVTAVSTNKLSNECYSTLFPEDIIYYDIENNQTMVPGCTKGYIYRRIDTKKNNDIGFDYRNVKFRRWQLNVTNEDADGDNNTYTKGNVVKKTGTNEVYIKLNDVQGLFSDTNKWKRFEFNNLTYIIPQGNNLYLVNGYYQVVLPVKSSVYYDYHMFSTQPTTGGTQSSYNNIYNNKIDGHNSEIVAYSNTVFFGSYFYSNTIGNYFSYNTIGNYFNSNTIGNNFSSNTIGNYFSSNNIGNNFNSNTIGNNFSSNTIGNNFNRNTIGEYFNPNTIGNNFNNNTIGNYFVSNTIGNYFNSNTIGNYFNNNTIGDNFYRNTIGNNFSSNTIGNNFNYNGGLDFTSAFYVYQNYPKKLFVSVNGTQLLSYYDEFGVENIVPANSAEVTD